MKKVHYAWIMLFVCFMICCSIGIYSSCSSTFVLPVCSELGLNRGEFALNKTIVSLIAAFTSAVVARLMDDHSAKGLLLVSTAVGALSYIGYSFCRAQWQFYICALFNGVTAGCNGFVLTGILLSRWFMEKRSTASGIAYCGSGLGGAVAIRAAGALIEKCGWRMTYRIMGVTGLVMIIPVVVFLLKDYPSDLGVEAYGYRPVVQTEKTDAEEETEVSFSDIRKTGKYKLLSTSLIIIYAASVCANQHTVAYLQDEGHSASFATGVMSFVMIVLMAGKILVGILYDRLGSVKGNIIVGACCVLYPLTALFAAQSAFAYAYAVLYGIGSTACSVPVSILIQKHFGNREYGAIFSRINMCSVLAGAAAAPVMGYAFDFTGSYKTGWIVLTALSAVAVAFLLLTDRETTE